MNIEKLESLWHREFPVARAMQVRVDSWAEQRLTVSAPLEHNHNIHGTGFAGSQYALAALCGWGAITLRLAELELPGSILTTEGNIRYRKPIDRDLCIVCDISGAQAEFDALARDGRTTLTLDCTVLNGAGGDAVSDYRGVYPVRLTR